MTHAICNGCVDEGDRPSIVVTFFAPTLETEVPQERTATPSRWTVQAPHCCRPQPNLVPVKPIASRMTQSSGVSGLTSTLYCLPLTVREIIVVPPKGRLY